MDRESRDMRTPIMPSRSVAPAAAWTVVASILLCAGAAHVQPAPAAVPMQQGWSATDRNTFYTTGQGSHLMPAAWFKALRRLDVDQPFAADQLARYGYLHNDSPSNLPVGFVVETRRRRTTRHDLRGVPHRASGIQARTASTTSCASTARRPAPIFSNSCSTSPPRRAPRRTSPIASTPSPRRCWAANIRSPQPRS